MIKTKNILFVQKDQFLKDHFAILEKKLIEDNQEFKLYSASKFDENKDYSFFNILISPTLPWLYKLINKSPQLEWIHFLSSGIEKIWDMPCDWRKYLLSKSSGIHGQQISEYVIAAILYFSKKFNYFVLQSQENKWQRYWLDELTGKKIMILGGGNIGTFTAKRCKEFGMDITVVQQKPIKKREGYKSLTLEHAEKIFQEVDFLVIALPLTDKTRFLINKKFLDKFKKGIYLVDVSRGGIVDSDAVLHHLDNGNLKGAALDVFPKQPLSSNSDLWNRKDVLITPHVAGTSPFYMERAFNLFIKNLTAFDSGEQLITPVSIEKQY